MRFEKWRGIGAGGLAFAIILAISMFAWQTLAPAARAQAPAPSVVPPGSGGVTFDAVRVLSGNNLPRNAGQEKQPPVWMTIDAKGASAVVTVGNATRVPLDFTGTIVISLAPAVQPGPVLVSTGSTVVQGNSIVWSGFNLSSGQILPSVISFDTSSGTPAASSATPAIQEVDIEAKDSQSGTTVTERVAGGGPSVATVASAPPPPQPASGAPAAAKAESPGSNPAVTPLSVGAAQRFAAWALALLGCILILLLAVALLALRLRGDVRGLKTLAAAPFPSQTVGNPISDGQDGLQAISGVKSGVTENGHESEIHAVAGNAIATRDGVSGGTAAAVSNAGAMSDASSGAAHLEVQAGVEQGKTWSVGGPELTIGRNIRNGVVLADPRVSDSHASIKRQPDGTFLFADQRSTNGSLLNGRLVREPTVLHDGDTIRIGGTTFVYRAELSQGS